MKVCLLNIAQWHQALHVLPIAAALSRQPGIEVHVATPTAGAADAARDLCVRLGAGPVQVRALWPDALAEVARRRGHPPKRLMLAGAAPFLAGCDAIVAPERTSLFLKRLGVRRPVMIHCDHGAGDRAVGYEPRLARFDFALLAGAKQEARMLREGLIRPGHYRIVGYPKFEAAAAAREPTPQLFPEPRPTVLYNPHFHADLGSWDRLGHAVLDAFARQRRYNLIFAPHLRLAQRRRGLAEEVSAYARAPHIHIDLGGPRSCDMTYLEAADIYLGDVSSQVYEFIARPRPCAFLDPADQLRPQDENAAHVRFGPVAGAADEILPAVDAAVSLFDLYRPLQVAGFRETFDLQDQSSSARAADAIVEAVALARRRRRAGLRLGRRAAPAAAGETAA